MAQPKANRLSTLMTRFLSLLIATSAISVSNLRSTFAAEDQCSAVFESTIDVTASERSTLNLQDITTLILEFKNNPKKGRPAALAEALKPWLQDSQKRMVLMNEIRRLMVLRSNALKKDLKLKKIKVDIAIVGGGPHGVTAAVNAKLGSKLENILVISSLQSPDNNFSEKGEFFWINSPELQDASTNEIPGSLLRLKDIVTTRRFATAGELGDFFLLTQFLYSDTMFDSSVGAIAFETNTNVYKLPISRSSVSARSVVLATGLGSKAFLGVKDEASLKLYQKGKEEAQAKSPFMIPQIAHFDDLTVIGTRIARSGGSIMDQLAGKDVAVLGKGDGANGLAEAVAGYGPPSLYANDVVGAAPGTQYGPGIGQPGGVRRFDWHNQNTTTPEQFMEANKKRYHRTVPSFFALVQKYGYRAVEWKEELVGGVRKYRLFLQTETDIIKSEIAYDFIFLGTGNSSDLPGLLANYQIDPKNLNPVKGRISGINTPVTVAVTPESGRTPSLIAVGPAAGEITTPEELEKTITKSPHSINVLAVRTQKAVLNLVNRLTKK